MLIQKEYNYEDIYLVPQKRIVETRSECNISVRLGSHTFNNPVIAANMKAVVDWDTCKYLAKKNLFYIMHRFHNLNKEDFFEQIKKLQSECGYISFTIGVQEEDKNLISYLYSQSAHLYGLDYITIDVAHAHSTQVTMMIRYIKKFFPNTFLIVGNVATIEGVQFLADAGADCVKLFVGPGAACTTKLKTGFTRGTVSCLLECAEKSSIPLIADGGIRNCGDIAKAMACGADMVMAGMFMCGYYQSPGETLQYQDKTFYLYYGSASYNMKRDNKHIEGKDVLIPFKGNMDYHIEDIECSLRSACSYGGVEKIKELYLNNDLKMITFK